MSISNASDVAYLAACIKVSPSVPVTVILDGDLRYRLVHLGLNEDLGADTERVMFRCRECGKDAPADLAAVTALSGLLGEGILASADPELQIAQIGPRVQSVQFLSAGQTAPVVMILPCGIGGRQ